jgi:ATP-dependent RNA helicase DBP3
VQGKAYKLKDNQREGKLGKLLAASAMTTVHNCVDGAANSKDRKKRKGHNDSGQHLNVSVVKPEEDDKQDKKQRRTEEKRKRKAADAPISKHGHHVSQKSKDLSDDSRSMAAVGDVELARASKPIRRNLYAENASLAAMTPSEIDDFREGSNITVNGTQMRPITSFKQLGLKRALMHAVKDFSAPTPIQSQCWPLVLSGKDLIGIASTGSGTQLLRCGQSRF